MTKTVVIDAETFDVITCPGCRVCVGRGRVCECEMRTYGPKVEPILQRIVNKRITTPRRKTPA